MNELNIPEIIKRSQVYDGNCARIKAFLDRAKKGESLKIAFIGGSITQGCHAATVDGQYTHRVHSWFMEKFPKSEFEFINAPVGATGSQFGNARINKQVLQFSPDFLLVEFAVNDEGDDFHKETYEGLIRTILSADKVPAVLGLMNVIINENGDNAQKQHIEVLKNYSIPAVSMKDSFWVEFNEGRMTQELYSNDRVHPTDFGHEMVAKVITTFLDRINNTDITDEPIMELAAPVTENKYQNAVWLQNQDLKPSLTDFTADDRKPDYAGDNFVNGWSGTKDGAVLSFSREMRGLAIQYRRCVDGPVPKAEVIIDGNEESTVILDGKFDETWGDCLALTNIFCEDDVKKHDITLKVVDMVENSKPFYVVSFIIYE